VERAASTPETKVDPRPLWASVVHGVVAYVLSNWSFLEVLEYLSSFGVLIAVVFYFSESGDRPKQKPIRHGRSLTLHRGGRQRCRIDALQNSTPIVFPLSV